VVAQKALNETNSQGFTVSAKGAELNFLYWPDAPVFGKSLLTPADCLINELAYQLHITAQSELSLVPLTHIELALRQKYFPELHPDLDEVTRQIDLLESELREHLLTISLSIQGMSANLLSDEQKALVTKRLVRTEYASEKRIESALNSGEFIKYVSIEGVVEIVLNQPEYLFDGQFFSFKWENSDFSPMMRDLLRDLRLLLEDVLWFKELASSSSSNARRGRMKRLIGSLEMINDWRTSL